MKILVVGCGRFGSELAARLSKAGNDLVVIDNLPSAFHNLPEGFHGRTIEGNGLNQEILYRADIKHVDAVAAVTNSDILNATIAHIAKKVFGIETVIARNYDPANRSLFEVFSTQVISSTSWGIQRVVDMICQPDVNIVLTTGNGEVSIIEIRIPVSWKDRELQDLIQPGECIVISLTRAGHALLPSPKIRLVDGDILHISVTRAGTQFIRKQLSSAKEE